MQLSFPGGSAEQSQQSFAVNLHPCVSCTIPVFSFLLDLVGNLLSSVLIFWFVWFSSSCASVCRVIMEHLENVLKREITNVKIKGTWAQK